VSWQPEHRHRLDPDQGQGWFEERIGDFVAAYRLREDQGDLVFVEFRFYFGQPGSDPGRIPNPLEGSEDELKHPIPPSLVAKVPIARHLAMIRSDRLDPPYREGLGEWLASLGFRSVVLHPGVRRTKTREIREIAVLVAAALYDHEMRGGNLKRPGPVVREQMAKLGFPYSIGEVKNTLSEARRRGYLSKARDKGLAGGHLTPQAREALGRLPDLLAELASVIDFSHLE
jgi:hypothetical protein